MCSDVRLITRPMSGLGQRATSDDVVHCPHCARKRALQISNRMSEKGQQSTYQGLPSRHSEGHANTCWPRLTADHAPKIRTRPEIRARAEIRTPERPPGLIRTPAVKLCVIENSHSACLKLAWDQLQARYLDHSITFFAQRGIGMSGLMARGKMLVPAGEPDQPPLQRQEPSP